MATSAELQQELGLQWSARQARGLESIFEGKTCVSSRSDEDAASLGPRSVTADAGKISPRLVAADPLSSSISSSPECAEGSTASEGPGETRSLSTPLSFHR